MDLHRRLTVDSPGGPTGPSLPGGPGGPTGPVTGKDKSLLWQHGGKYCYYGNMVGNIVTMATWWEILFEFYTPICMRALTTTGRTL